MPSSSYDSAISLLSSGPSRPTLYEVNVPLQGRQTDTYLRGVEDYLRLFVTQVTLPDMSHEFIPIPGYRDMGITQKVPVMPVYGQDSPLVIRVIENTEWSVYDGFRRLYEMTGNNINHLQTTGGRSRNIRMNYKDDFQFEMDITKLEFSREGFEHKGDVGDNISAQQQAMGTKAGYHQACRWNFYNCYVTSFTSIDLSSQAVDTPLSYGIGIQYDSYTVGYINGSDKALTR